jgi:hypothetical protein
VQIIKLRAPNAESWKKRVMSSLVTTVTALKGNILLMTENCSALRRAMRPNSCERPSMTVSAEACCCVDTSCRLRGNSLLTLLSVDVSPRRNFSSAVRRASGRSSMSYELLCSDITCAYQESRHTSCGAVIVIIIVIIKHKLTPLPASIIGNCNKTCLKCKNTCINDILNIM